MCKIVVYTAIFNNYDWLKEPYVVSEDLDYICYTDNKDLKSDLWKIKVVDTEGLSPAMINRKIKLLYPYTELSTYDYSLYVDGSIMIKGDTRIFLNQYLSRKPIIMNFKHPNNDCIYREMDRLINSGWNKDKLEKQRDNYMLSRMPEHYGLSDNKIILRDNHNEEGKRMMEEWFNEVINYSGRDQTCLSYILFSHHKKYNFFLENIEENPYFETWPHNNAPWYNQYWRKTKWFCERHNIAMGFINFLNKKLKPVFLKFYLKK